MIVLQQLYMETVFRPSSELLSISHQNDSSRLDDDEYDQDLEEATISL